jgi:hypothetical protein
MAKEKAIRTVADLRNLLKGVSGNTPIRVAPNPHAGGWLQEIYGRTMKDNGGVDTSTGAAKKPFKGIILTLEEEFDSAHEARLEFK